MITKQCEICKNTFNVPQSRNNARFCSRECYLEYHSSPPITKICEICGSEFTVKRCRKDQARFCSKRCGGKWHQSQRPGMGHRFKKGNKHRSGLVPANAFTSEQMTGKNSPFWVDGEEFVCENCGKTFSRKPWIVRQSTPRFCSRKCFTTSRAFVGSKSSSWVGGPKTYRGQGWRKARLLAVERDNGTCQRCGEVIGKSISVHHVCPFREFPTADEANSLDNLICLCQTCHMRVEPPVSDI